MAILAAIGAGLLKAGAFVGKGALAAGKGGAWLGKGALAGGSKMGGVFKSAPGVIESAGSSVWNKGIAAPGESILGRVLPTSQYAKTGPNPAVRRVAQAAQGRARGAMLKDFLVEKGIPYAKEKLQGGGGEGGGGAPVAAGGAEIEGPGPLAMQSTTGPISPYISGGYNYQPPGFAEDEFPFDDDDEEDIA